MSHASDDPILGPLNEPQRQAVTHAAGPLLVVAGPGSGKTRVITHRVAHLVRSGVSPDRILAITFTNRAAAEMRERIDRLLNLRTPWISTFHSFAARLLRRHIHRLPPFTSSFSIYDADDSLSLIKQCINELDVSTSIITPRAVRTEISRLKNRGIEDPDAMPPTAALRDRIVAQVYSRYIKGLQESNALDFDDLLLFLVRLLDGLPDVGDYYRKHFLHVLIDEYQDTNQVQYRIGKLISREHRNLCATGDPDQSIYSWRGADIRNILSFERDFSDTRVVKLEQNYRSTKSILRAANAIILHNTSRKEKTLWTGNPEGDPVRVYCFRNSAEEAAEIINLIEQFRNDGLTADQIAIFYRINALSRELEQALVFNGIPYTIVGSIEFFQRKEIRDLLAYLKILVNRRDTESLRRIINVPARGIGKTTVDRVFEAAAHSGVPPLEVILDPDRRPRGSRRMQSALDTFAGIHRDMADLPRTPVADVVSRVYRITGYEDHLLALDNEESTDRTANVEELVNAAAQYDDRNPQGDLDGFVQEISLFSSVDRWEHREDRVTLMTLHSAKGLEFPVVIICGLEEGILPLQRADDDADNDPEEERRLFFVGITRACKKLYVTHAESRLRFGRVAPSTPSSFLRELVSSGEEKSLNLDDDTRRALRRATRPASSFDWDEDENEEISPEGDPCSSGGDPLVPRGDPWDDDLLVEEDPYPEGARVRHEKYGNGTVRGARGQGRMRRLTIEFEDHGEKQIFPEYASLRRLS